MKQASVCLSCLMLVSCAATVPRFTVSPPSPGWMQVITVAPDPAPAGRQPLLKLRHKGTGAEITVDIYAIPPAFGESDGRAIARMAKLVQEKMQRGFVICEPISYEYAACGGHGPGDLQKDILRAGFRTTLINERGETRRGKVSVRQVSGAGPGQIFVFAGQWRDEDDLQAIMEFDRIVDSAAVK